MKFSSLLFNPSYFQLIFCFYFVSLDVAKAKSSYPRLNDGSKYVINDETSEAASSYEISFWAK